MSDELLALIREQELINRWRPEFNTQGQPVKRQPAFIVITGGIAPNASFTRRIPYMLNKSTARSRAQDVCERPSKASTKSFDCATAPTKRDSSFLINCTCLKTHSRPSAFGLKLAPALPRVRLVAVKPNIATASKQRSTSSRARTATRCWI